MPPLEQRNMQLGFDSGNSKPFNSGHIHSPRVLQAVLENEHVEMGEMGSLLQESTMVVSAQGQPCMHRQRKAEPSTGLPGFLGMLCPF